MCLFRRSIYANVSMSSRAFCQSSYEQAPEKQDISLAALNVTYYSCKHKTPPNRPWLQWTSVVFQLHIRLLTESNADKSKLLLQRSAWVNQCNQTWCSNAQLQNTTSTNRFMVWKQLLFSLKTCLSSLKCHPINEEYVSSVLGTQNCASFG